MPQQMVVLVDEPRVKLATVVAEWGGRVVRVEIGEIGSANGTSLGGRVVAR
ncbi:MAG: hypothetical protein ABSD62_11275 [Candidatus Limnocylindrales bacterium]|jgi:hypothetical protein